MKQLLSMLTIVVFALGGTPANAKNDDFPNRAITMIIPFVPGGALDLAGRVIAKYLSEQTTQSVIAENRSGTAGNIGMLDAARAKPDGYTAFFGNVDAIAIKPSVFSGHLRLNPEKYFIAVTQVVDVGAQVKALAFTTPQRAAELLNVPTVVKLGWPIMIRSSWQGIFVPKGATQPVAGTGDKRPIFTRSTGQPGRYGGV